MKKKGYIAFCPHFHQPHFQLQRIREQVYNNSYCEWLDFLEKNINVDGFFINIHFSGPFLYWIKNEKVEFYERLKRIIASKKVGIIGGFADEAFVQLSTRKDDVFFQMSEYANLTKEMFDVFPKDWQAIHIPERECGELLIDGISMSAKILGAKPIYYLDVETCYKEHYEVPGGTYDYCKRIFGFDDNVSRTTYPYFPQEIMHFCFRDEIAGREFFSIPIHKEQRYKFLKTTSFNEIDSTQIEPHQYLDELKERLNKAHELSLKLGVDIEPIIIIFEDAEKFGDWSKNPQTDHKWLNKFIDLVVGDSEVQFIGIKEYIERVGYFDTYPIYTSHSYPEWENWTAKRGIRGATFGDERLRRSLSRLHLFEEKITELEEFAINKMEFNHCDKQIKSIVFDSVHRFDILSNFMQKLGVDKKVYRDINRIRNVVYQEDSKWASRHPNYGSSQYFDGVGLGYIELADRIINYIKNDLGCLNDNGVKYIDWDRDGREEILISSDKLTAVLDECGGCISYCYAISPCLDNREDYISLLRRELEFLGSYQSMYKFVVPFISTETDSRLVANISSAGSRKENARNGFRCNILEKTEQGYKKVCEADTATYSLDIKKENELFIITCKTTLEAIVKGCNRRIQIVKKFVFEDDYITVDMLAKFDGEDDFSDIYLVPEIVTSITPSDEVNFKPSSNICFAEGVMSTKIQIKDVIRDNHEKQDENDIINWSGDIVYNYSINSGNEEYFENSVNFSIATKTNIEQVLVEPAVKNFYEGYVHCAQSCLGYDSSGLAILPYISFYKNQAQVTITCKNVFNNSEHLKKYNYKLINN